MRFTRDILDLFAAASRDYSPLHMSDEYARTTPFGRRVVHGASAVLAGCSRLTPPPDSYVSRLKTAFYQPVFLDIEYQVKASWIKPERALVSLMDGSTQVLESILDFSPGLPVVAELPEDGLAPCAAARRVDEQDLSEACIREGQYSPGSQEYLGVLKLFSLERSRWGDALFLTLMASSYCTGMELPGVRAMYFQLQANFGNQPIDLPTRFTQELVSFDQRWGMVKSRFRMESASAKPWAQGEIQAFLRPLPTGVRPLSGMLPSDAVDALSGKSVLVVGASRGLGAYLTLSFASAGANVTGLYARSSEEAEQVRSIASGLPGEVDLQQCDATNLQDCERIRDQVLNRYGRLDWLVCSAAPPPLPLRIEPAAFERIDEFVRQGLRLVLAPLSAFLPVLAGSGGSVLLISSAFVEDPPPIWPQYVTLKCAVEGLLRVAAAEYPKVAVCIARPDKLLTDMTNTPIGRVKAEEPGSAAMRIVAQAVAAAKPGFVSYVK